MVEDLITYLNLDRKNSLTLKTFLCEFGTVCSLLMHRTYQSAYKVSDTCNDEKRDCFSMIASLALQLIY